MDGGHKNNFFGGKYDCVSQANKPIKKKYNRLYQIKKRFCQKLRSFEQTARALKFINKSVENH